MNSVEEGEVKGMVAHPCHPKEKIVVYFGCTGRASVKCPMCDTFTLFDYDNMSAKKVSAVRGAAHKYKMKI